MNSEIKLFLSSVFKDKKMQERRDYFRNEINAELNHIVGQVGKKLFLYDYELGIPEKTPFAEVLNVCFVKIDICEYFVAIIDKGVQGYGAIINGDEELKDCADITEKYERLVKAGLSEKYQKLVEKGLNEKLSVLELEIRRAIADKDKKKLFFIRQGAQESHPKTRKLIQYIEEKGDSESIKPFSEDTTILDELKSYFKEKEAGGIEKLSKEERNLNLMYVNKMRYYVDDKESQNILSDYLEDNSNKVLVLWGKSGSGKSTLLLNWTRQLKEDENISNVKSNIISAFAGVDGNTISEILLKIYSPTNEKLDINQEEKDEESLLGRFAQFTFEISKQFPKTIIIIDGINQLEFTSDWKNNKYWWLNKQLEKNVKVIVTATDNAEDTHFVNKKMPPQKLLKLIEAHLRKEGKELIYKYFHGKLDFIKDGLPAFAGLLCTEICMTAKYDTLNGILDKYKTISDILVLYKEFLKRLSERHSLNNNTVRELCSYIYYSENGLRRDILQQLFKDQDEQINSFYFLLYHELMRSVEDKITFSTDYFRQAVKELYGDFCCSICCLNYKETAYRTAIINVLEKSEHAKEIETLTERAYQIYRINDKQRMYDLLSDIDNAVDLFRMNRFRFLEYLNLIEDKDNLYKNISNENLTDKIIIFLSYYYKEIANYDKALEWLKYALMFNEKVYGKEHPNTAFTYNNIALVYHAQGKYDSALEYYGKDLTVSEIIFGETHPNIATTYNNIGKVYRTKGDYDLALEYYGKALKIWETTFGKEHPSTATTYNNMAEVYRVQGNYDSALEYNRKVKTIREKILGKEHRDTATIYNNMALVYYTQGNYNLALEYNGKALGIKQKLLGKEHPDTATTYNNIATVYYALGNYDHASEYFGKALDIREVVFGKEHPDTATTYNNIGEVYRLQGNYDRALEYFGKALAIREKVLGKEHSDTATSYNNLAAIYRALGNYVSALEYFKKALIISKKTVCLDHPDLAAAYNNIGEVYRMQGNHDRALEYFEKALAISERVFGTKQPNTATIYNNIGEVYRMQGNYDRALEYYGKDLAIALEHYGKALAIREKVFGKENPDTATTYNNIAVVYDTQGDYDLALEWYLKSLLVLITVLGFEHPTTKTVFNNMSDAYGKSGKTETFEEWLAENLPELFI